MRKEETQELVAKGKIIQAISLLKLFNLKIEEKKILIVISGRFYQAQKHFIDGLITYSECDIVCGSLAKDLLDLIEEIDLLSGH